MQNIQHIIVSDIFGKTEALKEIAFSVSSSAKILDPYQGIEMDFNNEKQAYAYFMGNVGLTKYITLLIDTINNIQGKVSLIGFSVGASAIWACSDQFSDMKISSAICFYGSQIRHYMSTRPKFPIKLIFPAYEEHFSVQELIRSIEDKEYTQAEQVPFLHGFMNKHSQNFCSKGYGLYFQELNTMSS